MYSRTEFTYVLRIFHRSWGMYLRTYSPYLDSLSLVIVNFRIQLELIYWALYSTVDCTCHRSCLTYIPSLLPDLTVFTHKVPSQSVLYNKVLGGLEDKIIILKARDNLWLNDTEVL